MREYAGPDCFTALRLFDLRIKLHKRPGKVRRGSLAKGEEWHGKQEEGEEAGEASCIAIVIHTGQIRLVYNGAHNNSFPSLFPHLLYLCLAVNSSSSSLPPEEACRLINLGKRRDRLVAGAANQSTDESTTLSASSVSLSLSLSLSFSFCLSAGHTLSGLWQFKNHIKLVSKKSPQRNHQQIISN